MRSDETRLDVRDPARVARGFRFVQQSVPLDVGLEHHFDQAFGAVGRLLSKAADAPARGKGDGAGLRRKFTADCMEQGGLADAVAADKADASAGHDLYGTMVDQKPSGDADRDVGEGKHGGFSPLRRPNATHLWSSARGQRPTPD